MARFRGSAAPQRPAPLLLVGIATAIALSVVRGSQAQVNAPTLYSEGVREDRSGRVPIDDRGEAEIKAEALKLAQTLFPGMCHPRSLGPGTDRPSRRVEGKGGGGRGARPDYGDDKYHESIFEISSRSLLSRITNGVRERRCVKCWMRGCVCICDRFESARLKNGHSITVFMHPGEYLRGSNTGHLIPLLLGEQAQTLMYGVDEDHKKLAGLLSDDHTVILYPSAEAQPITSFINEQRCRLKGGQGIQNRTDTATKGIHLILVDGTWKTSKKLIRALKSDMMFSSQLQFVSIPEAEKAVFDKLRKQTRDDGCSTIEAAAMALDSIGDKGGAIALRQGLHVLSDALDIQRGDPPRHHTFNEEEILITRRRVVRPHQKYVGTVKTAAVLARRLKGLR